MDEMKEEARKLGFHHIAFGVNMSDFGEHRPGIKALDEEGFSYIDLNFNLLGLDDCTVLDNLQNKVEEV